MSAGEAGPGAPAGPSPDARCDTLLGGRLQLLQAAGGHRAGTDAVLLVAAAGRARHVVDMGSGVGAVGLGLLALGRCEHAILVERDPAAAGLARANIERNGLVGKAAVAEADIAAGARRLAAAGLPIGAADLVVANPPYNEPGRHRASPHAGRAEAHAMTPEAFEAWVRAAARALGPGGRFVIIHRPEALPWLLPLLASRFGALSVVPVHTLAGDPARRVLISARLGSKAPARVLPALVLHVEGGGFTELSEALHRGEAMLAP